ncbi:MAG: ligase-associated DNA damage response exonuclease [Acidobacteriota bacterium]
MLILDESGFYCPEGDFHIDPWRPVPRALVTHSHADHAHWGCGAYLAAEAGERVLRRRMGDEAVIETVPWGESLSLGPVRVSFHPAGHILGSAQIRLDRGGEVWVVSGDYKTEPDATCAPFELVPCNTFVTESTFGLPIFRWAPQAEVFDQVNGWWRKNAEAGRASLLFGYALGKAQRLLAGVDPSIGPIFTHGAVENLTGDYRDSGVALPDTTLVSAAPDSTDWAGSLVVAPPSANGTPWMRRFGEVSTGFASGWMRIRGTRRRRAMDRGFVLSDHVDWPALVEVLEATGAERVWVTHGYREAVVRWLRERGIEAMAVASRFEGELDEAESTESKSETAPGGEAS